MRLPIAYQIPLLFPHALAFFLQRIQFVPVQVLSFEFTEQATATAPAASCFTAQPTDDDSWEPNRYPIDSC